MWITTYVTFQNRRPSDSSFELDTMDTKKREKHKRESLPPNDTTQSVQFACPPEKHQKTTQNRHIHTNPLYHLPRLKGKHGEDPNIMNKPSSV